MSNPIIKVLDRRESLAQSVISDIVTFAFLVLCIWFSWHMGGGFWTFFTVCMFLLFISAKSTVSSLQKFRTKRELLEWANSLPDDEARP